jgi:hypothetical protein
MLNLPCLCGIPASVMSIPDYGSLEVVEMLPFQL